MKSAVIVTTYNQPVALRRALLCLKAQTARDFTVVVADDGSREETRKLLSHPDFAHMDLLHLWQRDEGWRKTRIQNLAIASVDAEHLIFLDGDCLPRNDFVEAHRRVCRPGSYVSGSRVHVEDFVLRKFSEADITTNRIFEAERLARITPHLLRSRKRLERSRWTWLYDLLTTRLRVFHGSNASAWREDLYRVNGFDETFGYGSEDRELGMRLSNVGVRSRWLKYTLVQLHMAHISNGDKAQMRQQRDRLWQTFWTRRKWCDLGLDTILERHHAEQHEDRSARAASEPHESSQFGTRQVA